MHVTVPLHPGKSISSIFNSKEMSCLWSCIMHIINDTRSAFCITWLCIAAGIRAAKSPEVWRTIVYHASALNMGRRQRMQILHMDTVESTYAAKLHVDCFRCTVSS